MPLQIGAVDMAFPRLNMGSVILFFISAVLMFGSFFVPGGAAKSGWTSYTPLATISDQPQNTVFFGHNFHFIWPMCADRPVDVDHRAWPSTSPRRF